MNMMSMPTPPLGQPNSPYTTSADMLPMYGKPKMLGTLGHDSDLPPLDYSTVANPYFPHRTLSLSLFSFPSAIYPSPPFCLLFFFFFFCVRQEQRPRTHMWAQKGISPCLLGISPRFLAGQQGQVWWGAAKWGM